MVERRASCALPITTGATHTSIIIDWSARWCLRIDDTGRCIKRPVPQTTMGHEHQANGRETLSFRSGNAYSRSMFCDHRRTDYWCKAQQSTTYRRTETRKNRRDRRQSGTRRSTSERRRCYWRVPLKRAEQFDQRFFHADLVHLDESPSCDDGERRH